MSSPKIQGPNKRFYVNLTQKLQKAIRPASYFHFLHTRPHFN